MSQVLKDTDKEMMGCMTYKGSSCYKKKSMALTNITIQMY